MKIKPLMLAGFALLSSVCDASMFYENTLSEITPSSANVDVFSRHSSSLWLVEVPESVYSGEGEYDISFVTIGRVDGSSLTDINNKRDIDFSTSFALQENEKASFTGGVVGPNEGSWLTFDILSCDSECVVSRSYRAFVSQYIDLSNSLSLTPVEEITPSSCLVVGNSLFAGEDAIYRSLGCGATQKLDYGFAEVTEFGVESKTPPLWESGTLSTERYTFSSELERWAALKTSNDGTETSIVIFDINGEEYKSELLNVDGLVEDSCNVTLVESGVYVACIKDVDGTLSALRWNIPLDGESTQNTILLDESSSYASVKLYDDHIFLFEQLDGEWQLTNTDYDGNIYSERTGENLTLLDGKKVFNGDYLIHLNQYLNDSEQERFSILAFDALETNFAPSFEFGLISGVYSTYDYESEVSVFDEDTLIKDLTVEFVDLPSWLSFSPDEWMLVGTPTHDDVAVYDFTVTVGDGELSSDLETNLEVYLTPYTITFFESTLFERLGIDEAYSFSSLVSQLGVIQVAEDVAFSAAFDIADREDLNLEFSLLPTWLSYNDETGILSGTPTQIDVGEAQAVTITYVDPYDVDEEETVISFSIQVVEVDESFEVTSSGDASLSVGETYTYQLVVSDEETSFEDFTFTAALLPSWISFDETTGIFTGVAEENGDYLLQVVVEDEGGYVVLHSANITVVGDDSSSGGSMSFLYILLLPAAFMRKRLKITPL